MVEIKHGQSRRCLFHLADTVGARVQNDKELGVGFFPLLRAHNLVGARQEQKIFRHSVVNHDGRFFAPPAQERGKSKGRTYSVAVGIHMRRNQELFRRHELFHGFF